MVNVVFLWMKGNTHPWLGAGPPIVVQHAAMTAGRTVLEAGVGAREAVAVELSQDTGTDMRLVLVDV